MAVSRKKNDQSITNTRSLSYSGGTVTRYIDVIMSQGKDESHEDTFHDEKHPSASDEVAQDLILTIRSRELSDYLNTIKLRFLVDDLDEPSIFDVHPYWCPTPKYPPVVDQETGEIIHFVRCGKWSCWVCAAVNAQRVAGAIMLAAPSFSFTISWLRLSSPELTGVLRRFAAYLRIFDSAARICWVAELNPHGDGYIAHIHGFLHGSKKRASFYEAAIYDAKKRAGLRGISEVQGVEADGGVGYFAYLLKNLADPDRAQRFLQINSPGKRLKVMHASRGFWRDGVDGEPITRRRAEFFSRELSKLPTLSAETRS